MCLVSATRNVTAILATVHNESRVVVQVSSLLELFFFFVFFFILDLFYVFSVQKIILKKCQWSIEREKLDLVSSLRSLV